MNSFKILYNGKALTLEEIDQEIAKLWNVELSDVNYAKPIPRSRFESGFEGEMNYHMIPNWFDTLGFSIATEGTYFALRERVTDFFGNKGVDLFDQMEDKYNAVIDLWEEKDYKLIKL